MSELGFTTAVKMFLTKMVKTHSLPFEPESLPLETLKELRESEDYQNLKHYDSPSEM